MKNQTLDLPANSPADLLDLLAVLSAERYRGACKLVRWAAKEEWDSHRPDEQRDIIAEVDRRRAALAAPRGDR